MAEVCGSLRNLCVQNVLRCPHLIENGFEVLPLEVVQAILQTSIQNRCVASFKYVLKFWPVRVVVLRRKAQYFRFDYQEDPVARGYCQIEEDQFVAEAVSKHIYGRDETDAVEEIDLRGRNPGPDGTTALCKALIAVNKQKHLTAISSGTSPKCLIVHTDVCVDHSNPDTVFKALESNNGLVQLSISVFSALQLGDDRLCGFLKLLNPDHLTSLDFSYNGLAYYDNVNVELSTIFREMKKFTKLRALCLAHSDFGESHLRNLCEIIEGLPCLVSLDLSGNCIGSSIGPLLNSITQPLNCLKLAKCRIGNAGIETIARSKHSSQLREFDVQCNSLSSECTENLLYIFESSKNTLREFYVGGNPVYPLLRVNRRFLDLRIGVNTVCPAPSC